jgi:hypothetical protein
MNLLVECPDAQEYLQQVMADPDSYKRYPEEQFAQLQAGIFATSLVDRQNEAFAPEALESMAAQINERSLWMTSEHNPRFPPVGRILSARRFYASQSDAYFVVGVTGAYMILSVCEPSPRSAWSFPPFTRPCRMISCSLAAQSQAACCQSSRIAARSY